MRCSGINSDGDGEKLTPFGRVTIAGPGSAGLTGIEFQPPGPSPRREHRIHAVHGTKLHATAGGIEVFVENEGRRSPPQAYGMLGIGFPQAGFQSHGKIEGIAKLPIAGPARRSLLGVFPNLGFRQVEERKHPVPGPMNLYAIEISIADFLRKRKGGQELRAGVIKNQTFAHTIEQKEISIRSPNGLAGLKGLRGRRQGEPMGRHGPSPAQSIDDTAGMSRVAIRQRPFLKPGMGEVENEKVFAGGQNGVGLGGGFGGLANGRVGPGAG